MKYYKVDFTVHPFSQEACDVLSALLADIGFETFVPTSDGITAYVQQTILDKDAMQAVINDFIIPDISISHDISEAPDENWNQRWEQEGFQPIILDDIVCVHDTSHTDVPQCRYDIIINPRMAFGTGTHPTTQQILRQLCKMNLCDLRVIDAGCGTGVLGLLCSMRGAVDVFSYDIDSWSAENTLINAKLNGIHNIEVRCGDASVLPQNGDRDLLIANINRNILLADMPRFARSLRTGAHLLLSGFYESDIPMLQSAASDLGFVPVLQTVSDTWAMLMLRYVRRTTS